MSKNIIFLLLASVVVSTVPVIISREAGSIGVILGSASATVGIAIILSFIPAVVYWLFKRKRMPGLNITIWLLWGVFAAINLVGGLR